MKSIKTISICSIFIISTFFSSKSFSVQKQLFIFQEDGTILVKNKDSLKSSYILPIDKVHEYLSHQGNRERLKNDFRLDDKFLDSWLRNENERYKNWVKKSTSLSSATRTTSRKIEASCIVQKSNTPLLLDQTHNQILECVQKVNSNYSGIPAHKGVQLYIELLKVKNLTTVDNSFWESIENHNNSASSMEDLEKRFNTPSKILSQILYKINEDKNLNREQCKSETLNAIYESLLAKNIIELERNREPNERIFNKILTALKEIEEPVAKQKKNRIPFFNLLFPTKSSPLEITHALIQKKRWINDPKFRTYPSSGKSKKTQEELNEVLNNHGNQEVLLLMDYFMTTYGISRKIEDGREKELSNAQRDCYSFIQKARGTKDLFEGKELEEIQKTNIAGIAKNLTISALEIDAENWRHSGKEIKKLEESIYKINANKLQIPIICGISGSTNIFLWKLFSLDIKFDEQELRKFLLYIWATLCVDGGHSLQEVLSSAKIISEYLKNHPEILKHIPEQTLKSLNKITDSMSIDGSDQKHFGRYYDDFFSFLVNDPIFKKAREVSQKQFVEIYSELNCDLFSKYNHLQNTAKMDSMIHPKDGILSYQKSN